MIHYRNLPTIYRNDVENFQIRRFERATRFKLSQSNQIGRRRTVRVQPQLLMNSQKRFFVELVALNEEKSKYLLYRNFYTKVIQKRFKFNKRGKSSESITEGTLNNTAQLIMLSLPYFCTNHNKRQSILKKWKQIIWGVRVILRYKKTFKEQTFFDQLSRLPKRRKLSSPTSGHRSPKKRRLPAPSGDNFTFAIVTKDLPEETSRSKTSRKIKNQLSENFQKSIYYQNLKQQELRLERLRNNSLHQLLNSQQNQSLTTARTQSVLIRKMRIKRQSIQ